MSETENPERQRIAVEAAQWYILLRDEDLPEQRAAYRQWLTTSPVHVDEALRQQDLNAVLFQATSASWDVEDVGSLARGELSAWKIGAALAALALTLLLVLIEWNQAPVSDSPADRQTVSDH